jgi:hypothetical protein
MKQMITKMMVVAMGTALWAGLAAAEPDSKAPTKEIVVEGGSVPTQRLKMEFNASKQGFDVDEPISFTVRTNNNAYLYLFNVTPSRVIQVFPNRYEKNNQVRANMRVEFPQKSKIKGDRPGIEKFVLIASAYPLNMTSREYGDRYFEIDKGEMEGLRKAIVLEGPAANVAQPAYDRDRTLRELDVIIGGGEPVADEGGFISDAATGETERPLVLVTTDKYRYHMQERVTFGYAADSDGYVKIYQVSPERKRTIVTEGRVEKGRVYHWNGRAGAPAGDYALVAVFRKARTSEDDASDDQFMKSFIAGPVQSKGLVPLDSPEIYSVHRFVID